MKKDFVNIIVVGVKCENANIVKEKQRIKIEFVINVKKIYFVFLVRYEKNV